ncbi:MAG: acetyltransferase [Mucilaginibacter sp.]|nr:acetyltransferase [Mucilaginibacter sp.]
MIRQYGILGTIKLFFSLIYTRILYPGTRLIRFPFDIRGRKFITWGSGFTTGVGCRLEAYPIAKNNEPVLTFGKNVQINDYVHITAMEGVIIGDNVLIASKVYISDCTHGSYAGNKDDSSPLIAPKDRPYQTKKVIIENNVWIGEFVSVLPGVKIGSGTIVGANSIVTKSLPANVIAVGSPAKPIKKYNFDSLLWEKY